MKEYQNKEALRRQYLLGTSSKDERSRLEESYLADDDAFEEMETTEEELVEAYVRGELPPSEHAVLKDRLLTSPRLLEKAKFARTLAKSLSNRRSDPAIRSPSRSVTGVLTDRPQPFWKRIFGRFFLVPPATLGVAVASCAVLLLACGALLLVQWLRLRDQEQKLAAERSAIEQQKRNLGQQSSSERARAEQLSTELNKEREERAQAEKLLADLRAKEQERESSGQSRPSTIAALTLFPGSLRGAGGGHDLNVTPGTKNIQLTLSLQANDYPHYRVSIKNAAGVEVVHREGLRPRSIASGPILVIAASTKDLGPGEYAIRVSGLTPAGSFEPVADYQFRLSTILK